MHKPRKRFGQNFLTDETVIDRIVSTIAPKVGENILEIGPGKGAMSLPLLKKSGELHVVEIDKDLISLLESFNNPGLHIYQNDVLKFDLKTLPKPLRVVGNLPYNISSPILFHLLESKHRIKDMTFMLQKEVVQRIVAQPGSKDYSRLSVMMQAFFETEMVFIVPPESFYPMPKVDSAIVYLKPIAKALIDDKESFAKIVKAAFSQKRKTLRNCLKSILNQQQTDIDLSKRAETLSIDDFVTLNNDYIKHHGKQH